MKELNSFENVAWNMSEAFLIRLDNLLGTADRLSIEGNVYGLFRILKRIYLNIFWKIEKSTKWGEDNNLLTSKFSDAEKDLKTKSNLAERNIHLVEEVLFEINKILMRILFEENMLYIEKDKKNWEDEVTESFS